MYYYYYVLLMYYYYYIHLGGGRCARTQETTLDGVPDPTLEGALLGSVCRPIAQ